MKTTMICLALVWAGTVFATTNQNTSVDTTTTTDSTTNIVDTIENPTNTLSSVKVEVQELKKPVLPLEHLMEFRTEIVTGGGKHGSDIFMWHWFGKSDITAGPFIWSTYPLTAAGPRRESFELGLAISFKKKKK